MAAMPAETPIKPTIKILVVDAERAFHEAATAAVVNVPGVELLCTTQPAEALNKLDQFLPTLMIVDGQLYGAAGINFVKRVRMKQTPAPEGTLVLFVAKEFTGGLSGRLCDAGCHGILRKPLSARGLAAAIQKILTRPVPFVLGGAYLGPDRRSEQPGEGYEPERRRTAARGGWTGTPPLFYRPDGGKASATPARPPAWKRPPPGAPARAAGSGGGIEGVGIPDKPKRSGGGGPLVDDPLPTAASSAGEPLADNVLAAKPKRGAGEPLVEAAAAKPKRGAGEPLAEPVPSPARAKVREVEEDIAAAPAPSGTTEFDLAGAVERHRQWLTSNGTAGAKADLSGIKLPGAQLANQNLAKASFRQTDLMNADLTMCVLVDADMRNAILAQAVLNQSQLAGAKLRHADLQFAQLVECGLQASDLAGANLRGAVLTGADLRGANLLGTNICGADFTSVVNLTQKQLDRATGDAKTVLPAGLFVGRGDA
jgi:CheY-like chemotaxis protein